MDLTSITFREYVKESDCIDVRNIVLSTGFFKTEEIDIAAELVEERLSKGVKSGYLFLFAQNENITLGYTCYGLIPCTKFNYDLYWIAVDNNYRGLGIGKKLLSVTENKIYEIGGKGIYIETSSIEKYNSTRAFYKKCCYEEISRLKDFYDTGDDKVTYFKKLS